MATTDFAAVTPPAAALPVINFIEAQITALVPSQYASAITAQFAGASSGSTVAAAPTTAASTMAAASTAAPAAVQLPAFAYPSAPPAGVGASAAQSTINFIQQQISALLPTQYASAITAQFAGSASSTGGSAASVQMPISTDLQNFFATQPTSSL